MYSVCCCFPSFQTPKANLFHFCIKRTDNIGTRKHGKANAYTQQEKQHPYQRSHERINSS